ncbi:MAG: OmpA family protein [Chitinophagaceae bacterium]|nr:OmpA family protein [Chitinophagaceae bacterium]
MATKRVSLLFGLFILLTSGLFAQETATSGSYDWRDSSLIPSKRLGQHNEFLNNQYNYPAKPRNQWEVGLKVGTFNIIGDVPSQFPTPGFGVHVRKSLGYVFSLRAEYIYGMARGVNWKARTAGLADHWIDAGYTGGANRVFDNYKANVQDLSLQGVFTMNNLRFHKGKTGFVVYGLAGFGATVYDTKVNVLTDAGAPYNFNSITNSNVYKDRKQTIKDVKNLLDAGSYNVEAENEGPARSKLFGKTLRFSRTVGAGLAIRLSDRLNLALEDRVTMIGDDLLDGVRWQNVTTSAGPGAGTTGRVLTPSYDIYNYLSLGLNINIGSKTKAVQPLWWLNPLDYTYSELNSPKHMKIPKPVLDDADGDGIPDQFDMEPNTPAGSPVDSHGVSRDTDGDGVPDYKDKELITPTTCQPVDADGVGKCPCPDESCFDGFVAKNKNNCGIGDLPSISFSAKLYRLGKDAEAVLANVADRLRQNPNCKIVVTSYTCEPSKSSQQLSWDRVNTVINYLVEKQGISADRLIFKYGESGGDCNTVDLRASETGDEGPNTVPAPHPNLRRR